MAFDSAATADIRSREHISYGYRGHPEAGDSSGSASNDFISESSKKMVAV